MKIHNYVILINKRTAHQVVQEEYYNAKLLILRT